MNVPISIHDELENDDIVSTAFLNLASGEITGVKFPKDYNVEKHGLPFKNKNYDFTYGVLSKDNKDMEFAIDVSNGEYSVNPTDLEELKEKSVKLFSGQTTTKIKNKF